MLWRLEKDGRDVSLLVQSPDWPNFQHLVEQAGWPGNESAAPRIADLSPLQAMIAKGRRFHFRVRLNTVSSTSRIEHPSQSQRRQLGGHQSVRAGQRTVGHQLDWFLRRFTGHQPGSGFSVGADAADADVQILDREHVRFRHGGSGLVSLDVATFEGVLVVTDADLMRTSLLQGIGKAKAYGCGLITLAAPGH